LEATPITDGCARTWQRECRGDAGVVVRFLFHLDFAEGEGFIQADASAPGATSISCAYDLTVTRS
jgi:hypothetical protein